jgi:hypothetical protein
MARSGLSKALGILAPLAGIVAVVTNGLALAFERLTDPGPSLLIGLLTFPLTVATILVFCFWFAKAYKAAPPDPFGPSLGWSIGSWFIPVANAFVVYGPALALWRRHQGEHVPAAVWTWLVGWSVYIVLAAAGGVVGGVLGGLSAVSGSGPLDPSDLPPWVRALSAATSLAYLVAGIGLAMTAARIDDAPA